MSRSLLAAGVLATALVPALAGAQPARPKPSVAQAAVTPVAAPKKGRVPAGPSIALVGATVHTGTGEVIDDATIVVVDGKVTQLGKGLAAPAGAETIAAKGLVVTPGLVDAFTSVGLVEIDLEPTTHDDHEGGHDRIRAGFRAADGYNPASMVIAVTRAEGVTSVGVVPTGGLFSGQSAWADLDGATAADALAAAPLALHVNLGARDADGGGHATSILRVREAFDDARAFSKNRAAWERNQSRAFAASRLDLEALVLALDGKVPVVFHADRATDLLAALAVAREFHLRPVLAGAAEGWKVAPALAAAKVPVFVEALVGGPTSFDTLGGREDNAALLARAGVTVGLSTFDTANARKLRQVAGNAVRAGLPPEVALAAVTRVPAEAFGLGARYGTLAPGKVANLVVWSGDPLELGTQVVVELIRGQRVSLRSRQTALLEKYRRLSR